MKIARHKLCACILTASISAATGAQAGDTTSYCPSPAVVLQRYVDAVGGRAVYDIKSRTITAKEWNAEKAPERYLYRLKWKAPNKVVAASSPYVFNIVPIAYPNGAFIFDGQTWSNGDGRTSRNEEAEPPLRRELRHRYPYNESPEFLMLRVVADPLMLTRANDLYSRFEGDLNVTEHPGLCVLRAIGTDEWGHERQDILSFDALTGVLRKWKIRAGLPSQESYVEFRFEDYRQVGAIRFPFSVYFDFYKAAFRYTKVVNNRALADSDFIAGPAKP